MHSGRLAHKGGGRAGREVKQREAGASLSRDLFKMLAALQIGPTPSSSSEWTEGLKEGRRSVHGAARRGVNSGKGRREEGWHKRLRRG